jgi:hypothetical protein
MYMVVPKVKTANCGILLSIDGWLHRLSTFFEVEGCTEDERLRLVHLLKVMSVPTDSLAFPFQQTNGSANLSSVMYGDAESFRM